MPHNPEWYVRPVAHLRVGLRNALNLEIGQQQIHDGAAVNGSPHGCAEAGDHDGGDDVVLGGAPCSCAGTGLVTPILRSHGYVGTPTRRQRRTICLI